MQKTLASSKTTCQPDNNLISAASCHRPPSPLVPTTSQPQHLVTAAFLFFSTLFFRQLSTAPQLLLFTREQRPRLQFPYIRIIQSSCSQSTCDTLPPFHSETTLRHLRQRTSTNPENRNQQQSCRVDLEETKQPRGSWYYCMFNDGYALRLCAVPKLYRMTWQLA